LNVKSLVSTSSNNTNTSNAPLSTSLSSPLANKSSSDSLCDYGTMQKEISNYDDFASCKHKVSVICKNFTTDDDAVRRFCGKVLQKNGNKTIDRIRLNGFTFNRQLVFSEYFNLFDFITFLFNDIHNDTESLSAVKASNQHLFDFIVVDFKSISNTTGWRPVMILEQNLIDKNAFIMHHAFSERDVFKDWILNQTFIQWKCGMYCWGIIIAILFIILALVLLLSVSIGVAARYGHSLIIFNFYLI
jgi:hypothetical protein